MHSSLSHLARKADFRSRMPQSSYYKNSQPGAALIRARKQYLVRNAFTGLGIFGFAIAVFSFTIMAVKQDEFEDVTVPTTPGEVPAGAIPREQ